MLTYVRRLSWLVVPALLLVGAGLLISSCQKEGAASSQPAKSPLFGNGFDDPSPVIAKVGDLEITQNMLDLRYEELPRNLKARFSGPGWEKRFLHYMVEEALLAQGALKRKLYLLPLVSQQLISQRRSTLKTAMREIELVKDLAPTEEQIRTYYEQNKEKYKMEGTMHARHVECQTKGVAQEAYDRIRQGGKPGQFALVVAEFSVNPESAKMAGDLGWFNKGGFIPAIPYGKEFSEAIWDWEIGLHEPVQIGDHWHVVEILAREYERPLTLDEARDRILKELTPILQEEAVEKYLRQAKQETPITYLGAFQPGGGKNPKELFEQAWYAKTPEQKIDIYKLLVEDYPQSDLADDALFMIANVYLDTWSDLPFASRYLTRLIEEYPDSELYNDSQYILENMGSKDFRSPTSIEDLRQRAKGK